MCLLRKRGRMRQPLTHMGARHPTAGANTGQGPDEAELHRLADVVQTHVRAASDIERTCDALVQAQIAANQAFEKFHLTLMVCGRPSGRKCV